MSNLSPSSLVIPDSLLAWEATGILREHSSDLGLIGKFSSENERFEVDGANAARQFLATHDVAGRGFDQFPPDVREQIVARYPRKRFRQAFIEEYFAGLTPAT